MNEDTSIFLPVEYNCLGVWRNPLVRSNNPQNIFRLKKTVYSVHGQELRRQRVDAGIRIKDFAEKCEWSAAFQRKMEKSRTVCWLTLKQVGLIKAAFVVLQKNKSL